MDTISTNLPKVTRLLPIKRTRKSLQHGLKILQNYMLYLSKIRNGNRFSRVIRHIFEHKQINIKRILGTNLALFVILSSALPSQLDFEAFAEEPETILSSSEDMISTEISIREPLKTVIINQNYSFFHPGVDFEGLTGDKVNPIMDGVIEEVQYSRYAYGNAIVVDHENGYKSLYAHLSKILVEKGQKVKASQIIGEVGSTGRSTGDHLHLEIIEGERRINPMTILSQLSL